MIQEEWWKSRDLISVTGIDAKVHKVLSSTSYRKTVHIASKNGTPICQKLGRNHVVLEKVNFMRWEDITCRRCRSLVESEKRYAFQVNPR